MPLIETGQNISQNVMGGQHVIDNYMIQFDPTLLNSSVCGGLIPQGLTGKYVLAEECTRFVYEHCAGKLRFFMILSGVMLFCVFTLMIRHDYFKKQIEWVKKQFKRD